MEQFFTDNLTEVFGNLISISETYRYLFLLYVGFLTVVVLINIIALFYKLFLEWKLNRMLQKLSN